MKVLVVNAGSSSLKYQLMDTATGEVLGKGICERIGMAGSLIDHKKADGTKVKKEIPRLWLHFKYGRNRGCWSQNSSWWTIHFSKLSCYR